ncbi:hypothetical protein B0H10DRAFT_1955781 [Mycena sp. CBHHK59/15]|nr:hypothetical protein B0H10DRAFT_1955781 [Mycena sp. CBHHK59/15]
MDGQLEPARDDYEYLNELQATDYTVNSAHTVSYSGQNYAREEAGRLSPSPFLPATTGAFLSSENAAHTSTFSVNTGPLECPKCEKPFGPGANEWSLRKHMEGKRCPVFILAVWYRLRQRIEADVTLHDKIPVFGGVHNGVFPYQAKATEDYRGVVYSFSIVNTPIFDAIANRQACRVCGKSVKDTDVQTHMGQHIRKDLRNVPEESVKCPICSTVVAKAYPCGTCGRSMNDGVCQVRIKSGKVDSDCLSAYAFCISSASAFRETRPCTNVPLQCPLNCEQMHWKYNFPQHLEERHPSWRSLVSPKFIEQITVTRAEELALGIPEAKALPWPPLEPPSSPVSGQKRTNPMSPRTPRRLHCKDNIDGQNKVPRLILKLPGSHSTTQKITVVIGREDVFQ